MIGGGTHLKGSKSVTRNGMGVGRDLVGNTSRFGVNSRQGSVKSRGNAYGKQFAENEFQSVNRINEVREEMENTGYLPEI